MIHLVARLQFGASGQNHGKPAHKDHREGYSLGVDIRIVIAPRLLPRLDFGSHDAHLIQTRALGVVDCLRDISIVDIGIALSRRPLLSHAS